MDTHNKEGSIIWYVLVGLVIIAIAVWALTMNQDTDQVVEDDTANTEMDQQNEEAADADTETTDNDAEVVVDTEAEASMGEEENDDDTLTN